MKKLLSLILTIVLVFSLCACSQTSEKSQETQSDSTQQAQVVTAAPVVTDPSSVQSQLQFIYDNLGVLKTTSDYASFWYTITDLDHNGRVEITAAATEGNASTTRATIYEMNSSYDGLNAVEISLTNGQSLPEIITNSVVTYQSGNSYNYIFTDTNGVGYEGHYKTIYSLALSNGKLTATPLAYQDVSYVNGLTVYDFYDKNGNTLNLTNVSDFDNIPATEFSGATKSTVNFDWFAINDVVSVDRLVNSYNTFAGTASAITPVTTATPAAIVTPVPTTWVVDTVPMITKNPTGEYLYEGGSCSFVAYATGYQYMAWQLVDTYGNVYAANATPYSNTMGVSGVNSPELTLTNVPLSMNGWSARAIFYGSKEVYSSSAFISVSSAPVVVKTVSASASSGSWFYDTYNYVYFYSSTGEDIHVEATRQGDTGPYLSTTIANGGCVEISGIYGQCLGIEVYANVSGSSNVAYFYYTVDSTPSPEPTYEPTPEPQEIAVAGVMGDRTSNMSESVYVYYEGNTASVGTWQVYPDWREEYVGQSCTVYLSAYGEVIRVCF